MCAAKGLEDELLFASSRGRMMTAAAKSCKNSIRENTLLHDERTPRQGIKAALRLKTLVSALCYYYYYDYCNKSALHTFALFYALAGGVKMPRQKSHAPHE